MGFLDGLLKDVEKGIDRVQQGADKLLSENTLRTEIEKLKRDQRELLAEIGEEAVALYVAGEIALPGMSMQIAQLSEIREKIEAKQGELTLVKQATPAAAKVAANDPVAPMPEEQPAQATPAAASATFCAHCGARLTAGAAFCRVWRKSGVRSDWREGKDFLASVPGSVKRDNYHILVTNDDGVQSPGILALRRALEEVARVTVLAPDHNWSAAGHNKTMHKPLWVNHAADVRWRHGDHDFRLALRLCGAGNPGDCGFTARSGGFWHQSRPQYGT